MHFSSTKLQGWGHEGTEGESALLGFHSHRLHLCHTGWQQIWANGIQQAGAGGAASFPSGTAHPVMPGLPGKAQLCPCSVRASSLSPRRQGWWKFSPGLEANTLHCITCSHTLHREENVMKPMLPVSGICSSGWGKTAFSPDGFANCWANPSWALPWQTQTLPVSCPRGIHIKNIVTQHLILSSDSQNELEEEKSTLKVISQTSQPKIPWQHTRHSIWCKVTSYRLGPWVCFRVRHAACKTTVIISGPATCWLWPIINIFDSPVCRSNDIQWDPERFWKSYHLHMEDTTLYFVYTYTSVPFLTLLQQWSICNVLSVIFTPSDHLLLLQTKSQQQEKVLNPTKLFFFFKSLG